MAGGGKSVCQEKYRTTSDLMATRQGEVISYRKKKHNSFELILNITLLYKTLPKYQSRWLLQATARRTAAAGSATAILQVLQSGSGGVPGSQRRIPACANAQLSQALAPVSHERSSIQVQSPSVWPLSGTENLRKSREIGGRLPEMSGNQDLCLLRWLAHSSSLFSTPLEGCPHHITLFKK